jgi:TPR repeat protein
MNGTAERFLACYAQGQEIEGGWQFARAVQQARLDGSAESLRRVDALLSQIRQKFAPVEADFLARPAGVNFCYLLAFYLGSYVAKSTGKSIDWHAYPQVLEELPADYGLPEAFFSQICGIVGGMLFLPLGWIGDKLFSADSQFTCADYVANFIARIEARSQRSEDEWCEDYLSRFFEDRHVEGGLVFREEIKVAQLDYSLQSLSRLDGLLRRWRETRGLDYERFVNQRESANTLLLLAYYFGTCVARAGNVSLHWIGFDEAREAVPELGQLFETKVACVLGGRIYFPLGVLTELLFAPTPERALRAYADEILAGAQPDFVALPRPGAQAEANAAALPGAWRDAAEALGFLAAYSVYIVADGGINLGPVLLKPEPDGKRTLVQLMGDTAEAGVQRGMDALEANQEHAPFLVLAFEGRVSMPGTAGRTSDAYVLEARCYGEPAFTLRIVLPFSAAAGAQRFAVDEPMLLGPLEPAVLAGVQRALYQGIDSFKAEGFSWEAVRRTGVDANAPASRGQSPSRAMSLEESDAFMALFASAEAGDAQAQLALAMRYEEGQGVPQSYAECVKWYTRAAEQGHPVAINNLADKYENGLGVPQDLARALKLYLQAADLDVLAAWYSLGNMYFEGRGVARDLDAAIRWMKLAAPHDFLDAGERLTLFRREAVTGAIERGRRMLEQATGLDAVALYEYATELYQAEFPETMPVAFELYLQAAKKGHAESQHQVGFRYHRGFGVTADAAMALMWYELSADQGNPYSLERLGELYEAGELVQKNPERAFAYYLKAANQNAITVFYKLACMYRDGRGTSVNPKEALRWMELSAKYWMLGNPDELLALREVVQANASAGKKKPFWRF